MTQCLTVQKQYTINDLCYGCFFRGSCAIDPKDCVKEKVIGSTVLDMVLEHYIVHVMERIRTMEDNKPFLIVEVVKNNQRIIVLDNNQPICTTLIVDYLREKKFGSKWFKDDYANYWNLSFEKELWAFFTEIGVNWYTWDPPEDYKKIDPAEVEELLLKPIQIGGYKVNLVKRKSDGKVAFAINDRVYEWDDKLEIDHLARACTFLIDIEGKGIFTPLFKGFQQFIKECPEQYKQYFADWGKLEKDLWKIRWEQEVANGKIIIYESQSQPGVLKYTIETVQPYDKPPRCYESNPFWITHKEKIILGFTENAKTIGMVELGKVAKIFERLLNKIVGYVSKDLPSKTESLSKEHEMVLNHEQEIFVPEASDGYFEHGAGFYIRTGDQWIVSELTYFRGTAQQKDETGNIIGTVQTVRPILFYNRNGERGYWDPREKVMEFDGKSIFLEGETDISSPLHTLMDFETAKRFLNGESVQIKDVYPIYVERIKKFVNCYWDKRLYDLIACVGIATHFYDIFGAFPIIFFYGPLETGKGRAGKCIIYGGHRGILVIDPTDATFFRMIDALRPTLFFDELSMAWETFQAHWRASYKKGAKVPRMEKVKDERMYLRLFEQYGPTLASSTVTIRGREREATISRLIMLIMKKASDPNPDRDDPEETDFDDIRNNVYLCRLTQAKYVDDMSKYLTTQKLLEGRAWELWRPILTIAACVSQDVLNNVWELAKEQVAEKKEEEYEVEKNIIQGIYNIFAVTYQEAKKEGTEFTKQTKVSFTPKELSDTIFGFLKEDFGYEDVADEKITKQSEIEAKKKYIKFYNPRRLGWQLKRMGLKKHKRHGVKGNEYILTSSELDDLDMRFGSILPRKEKQ